MKMNFRIIPILFAIISLMGVSFFIGVFFIGFHNMDLAYNICLIANDITSNKVSANFRLMEDNTNNGLILYTELYKTGYNQMRSSIYGVLCFGIALGLSLGILIDDMGEK